MQTIIQNGGVTVKSGSMNGGVLGDLSREWFSRPADERITGTDSMDARANILKQATDYYNKSQAVFVESRKIEVVPKIGAVDALALRGPSGGLALPSYWGMTQLCQRAGVPASYLRDQLSDNPALAAANLNYNLQRAENERVQLLLTLRGEHAQMVAATSDTYGRIWNWQILQAVNKHLGPEWTVPGIFGKKVDAITKENTSLFLSAQDMFIGLSDEEHKVEIKNRRDGKPGMLSRGILIGNSEVGAGKAKIKGFWFDYCCANRNFWGVEDLVEIEIRHSRHALHRWMMEAVPAIRKFLNAGTVSVMKQLEAARATTIPDPLKFLNKHFTKSASKAIVEIHLNEEHRPIENLWDANVGATAYARTMPYQDERLKIETIAGGFMPKA